MLYDLGRWEELVRSAEEIRSFSEAHGRGQPDGIASPYHAHVLVQRGATADAATLMDDTLLRAREIEDPQVLGPALVASALVDQARGDLSSARARIEEWETATRDRPYFRAQNLADAARLACAAGDLELAARLREGVVTAAERDRLSDLAAQASIAEAKGDFAGAQAAYDAAAEGWKELACVLEHGLALFGSARCLVADGRPEEAAGPLEEARQIFARLEARPLLDTIDDVLGTQRSATAG